MKWMAWIGFSGIAALNHVALWYNFFVILKIKAIAKVNFGASYGDNAIGFGQIIASGFAASVLVTFIVEFLFALFKPDPETPPEHVEFLPLSSSLSNNQP